MADSNNTKSTKWTNTSFLSVIAPDQYKKSYIPTLSNKTLEDFVTPHPQKQGAFLINVDAFMALPEHEFNLLTSVLENNDFKNKACKDPQMGNSADESINK
jgi:hypothetical protein